MQKWGHVTQEAHRHAGQACRDGVRKSKGHLEFYRYISNKWKTKENVALLLNGAEELVTKEWKCLRYLPHLR